MEPFLFRDMSRGVYRPSSVNAFLVPKNSAALSLNVNYDTIIGSGAVRPGTTLIGSTVASNRTPLGLAEFVASGGSTNLLIAVFSGASTATIFYYNGSWNTSGITNLNNSAKNRFAVFGNRIFRASTSDAMTSSSDGNTWTTADSITTDSVVPSLLLVTKNRMLASGYSGFRSRVYFSSIIDPNAGTFITWDTNPTTGDWIDVNPDDGGYVTALANTSAVSIIFKSNGMYRFNVVSKTVDTDNIFNIGAVSQEAVVNCQGIIYFFSGIDIRQTNGDYPQQISRLGVQDFIDAIPQANWTSVSAGTDGLNVYFSIGDVTLGTNTDNQETYTNVVLKFSPRDQTWSIHSYGQRHSFYAQYTTSTNGRKMVEADTTGSVQTVNVGVLDNTTPIYYELITQEIEQSSRGTLKEISDKIVVYTKYGGSSKIQVKAFTPDEGDFKPLKIELDKRVNIGSCDTFGEFLQFRWYGESIGTPPIFEGIEVPKVQDKGFTLYNG